MSLELLGLLMLALLVGCGAACFYAGWRSAAAYLPAALAVSKVMVAATDQANSYSAALDGTRSEMASLRNGIEVAAKASAEHDKNVEDALLALFQGLERAGLARAPRATPRQHGESPSDS